MDKSYTFSISPCTFWIKGKIIFEKGKIVIKTKDVILGIPSGDVEETVPGRKISSLKIIKTINKNILSIEIMLIILFILMIINADFFLFDSSLLIILLGIAILTLSLFIPKTTLLISKIGGKVMLDVPFYERKTLEKIEKEIEKRYIR